MKSWFFGKINKIDKPPERLTRKKEKVQIINTKNETTEPEDIKMIIKKFFNPLYFHKSDNLDKMHQFLKNKKLIITKKLLTQYEINNLNSPISILKLNS